MPYGQDRIWREHYSLHTYDLDARLRLSPQAACNFLVDTAAHNADALGFSVPQLLEQQRTWFLSRLLLRLHELPGWRAQLEVETWPAGFHKLFALRQWRVLHEGRQIGEAASAWLIMDNRTRRPIRAQSLATWGDHIREEWALQHEFAPLPGLEPPQGPGGEGGQPGLEERESTVRFSDVDINDHASYLSYVEWVLESVPPQVRSRSRLAELEIHYQAEVGHGERIRVRCGPCAGGPGASGYLHSLVRMSDGREACRARTLWSEPTAANASAGGA